MKRYNPVFIVIFLLLYSFPFGNGFFSIAETKLPFAFDLMFYLVIPVFISIYLHRFKQDSFAEICSEIRYDKNLSAILWAMLLGALSVRLFNFLANDLYRPSLALLQYLNVSHPANILVGATPTFEPADSNRCWHLVKAFYAAFTAAIVEEILYKAILIRTSKQTFAIVPFTIISSLLFTAVHFEQGLIKCLLILIIWGIPTSIYYHKERKLLPLIVMHFTTDIIFFF